MAVAAGAVAVIAGVAVAVVAAARAAAAEKAAWQQLLIDQLQARLADATKAAAANDAAIADAEKAAAASAAQKAASQQLLIDQLQARLADATKAAAAKDAAAVEVETAAAASAAQKAAQQQLLIDQLTVRLADAAKAAAASAVSEQVAEEVAGLAVQCVATNATTGPRSEMSDVLPPQQQPHAFSHAPAALRIFRFAADSAPRVLELAHVSAFLRECAVEFGSADATLPGALRSAYAAKRFFKLRAVVERNAARCPWLAAKVLACRSIAPMPAAALVPDVTRHDVNWGADGARRHENLQLAHGGFGLTCVGGGGWRWAQGPVGLTSGKHFFQVCITAGAYSGSIMVGFADRKISVSEEDAVGMFRTRSSGAAYVLYGYFSFGTAPLASNVYIDAPKNKRHCVIGCLLDVDAIPASITVFVDGEPLEVQCEYAFPKDGRAWCPSVALGYEGDALHSCAM